jgi:DNA-binding winged helix-turn-helix (wHTH) protein/tetratricopeptide (TPR) repeat protein
VKTPDVFEFDRFRLNVGEQILTRDGVPISLTPKAFDMLAMLVRNSGHVVGKDELRKEIWQDAFVEEGSLAVNVFALRKALGRSSAGREYIETVPKRGYRFVADVRTVARTQVAAIPRASFDGNPDHDGPAMIVVLPMQNLTGDVGMEHISDGFTEAIISQLARVDSRELSVIARTSAMTYKREKKTILEIASELRIDYAIESSLRSSGSQLFISVQLVRADRQTYLWAREYRREMINLLDIQIDVAQAVAERTGATFSARQEPRLTTGEMVSPEVYEFYLKGRHFCNMRTEEGLRRGIECLEQALALDPAYAPAHSALAACWVFWSLMAGTRPSDSFPRAKACALRALDLDPDLSEARAALGMVRAWYEFDWNGSECEFRRAAELEPGNATAHTWYAFFLGSMCRHEEASVEIRIALRHDPLSWAVRAVFGFLEEWAGRGLSAIRELEKALELNPRYYFARMLLGYFRLSIHGSASEAISQLLRACDDSGRQPDALSALGSAYAAVGMRQEALAILEELRQSSRYVSPYFLSRIHITLGDFDTAFRLLDEAFEERFYWLMMMQNEPSLRLLAGDPRYKDLLRRMAFPMQAPLR